MDVKLIEKVRERADKSQEQFAASIGMTKNGYQSLIKNGDLKVSTLEAICRNFNVDISYFFGPKNLSIVSEPMETYTKKDNCQDLRELVSVLKDQNASLKEQNTTNQTIITALSTTIEALNEQLIKKPAKSGKAWSWNP